jgi:hypothetical protein
MENSTQETQPETNNTTSDQPPQQVVNFCLKTNEFKTLDDNQYTRA